MRLVASELTTLVAAGWKGIAAAERRSRSLIQPLLRADQLTAKNELTAIDAAKPAASGAPPRGRPV